MEQRLRNVANPECISAAAQRAQVLAAASSGQTPG